MASCACPVSAMQACMPTAAASMDETAWMNSAYRKPPHTRQSDGGKFLNERAGRRKYRGSLTARGLVTAYVISHVWQMGAPWEGENPSPRTGVAGDSHGCQRDGTGYKHRKDSDATVSVIMEMWRCEVGIRMDGDGSGAVVPLYGMVVCAGRSKW